MPLGVDHLQFSVPCLEHAGELLRNLGFQQEFGEKDFDGCAPAFFRERGKSMAFFSTEDTRIEVINAAAGDGQGRRHGVYVPVFSPHAEIVEVPSLSARCRGPVSGHLSHVEVHVDNPAASREFWSRLGFQPESGSSGRLAFPRTMVGMGLAIELCERRPTEHPGQFVDDPGCSLIALIDRDATATLRDLEGFGSPWASYPFQINGRRIHIHMLRGPSGELVELIQLAPRR
jgi:catechol 2,3-dioxygenase-like lactoylglutathione lyase family enzyme